MNGFLSEKHFPMFVPGFESFGKALAMQFCELESKDAEFLCCFRDSVARDVLFDRLNLMELTELDGKTREAALEHCNDSFSSINDKSGEGVSCCKEGVQSFFVVHDLLRDDFLPVEVLAVGATYQDSIAPPEERGVHGDDNGTVCRRLHLAGRSSVGIKILPQRLRMFAVLPAQLRVCLLVCRVLIVGFGYPGFLLEAALLELQPALAAFVALPAPTLTVFLCAVRSSAYSAKLAFLNLEKDKTGISVSL